jgi:hypothetical protein
MDALSGELKDFSRSLKVLHETSKKKYIAHLEYKVLNFSNCYRYFINLS